MARGIERIISVTLFWKTESLVKFELKKHQMYGFLQIRPTPSPAEITEFYAKEFYSTNYKSLNNSAIDVQLADKEFHDSHREDICASIESLAGKSLRDLTVLDVGCGWAQMLIYMREKGARCFGFDPASEAVKYANSQGLSVRQAGMENLDVFPSVQFDVVMLLNVLEHLADPVGAMRQICSSVLRPGGILIVEVPNEFNAFQVCGQKANDLAEWWVSPPAHLNYFSNDSIIALLNGSGFTTAFTEASFPMEMFLLFGDNYVDNRAIGRACHEKRVAFERNLRMQGGTDALRAFYRSLAGQNLGRTVIAFATSPHQRGGG